MTCLTAVSHCSQSVQQQHTQGTAVVRSLAAATGLAADLLSERIISTHINLMRHRIVPQVPTCT
jgi:hypothetical protein